MEFAQREVHKKIVKTTKRNKHVFVDAAAATYLALVHETPLGIPPPLRAALYSCLVDPSSKRSSPWERADQGLRLAFGDAEMTIDTHGIDEKVRERIELLLARDNWIETNPDVMQGVPVFKSTRMPVDNVRAQLARGASVDELLSSYPTLKREHVVLAQLLNELGRPPGRPKKIKPLKIRRG
jgi:uncharacterized protein (DUF433 family)